MIKQLISIARDAGDAIMQYYEEPIKVQHKSDDSPLTKADLAAHHLIIERLQQMDGQTPIISEESGVPDYEQRKNWNRFWIVDPLDGTKEFIKKNGEFTVNIALIEEGHPVCGVIYVPARDLIYYGQKDKGSFKISGTGTPEQLFSTKVNKDQPLVVAASRSHQSRSLGDHLKKQGLQVKEIKAAGSSLKFCMVAEGTVDMYCRTGPTMEWDVAAGDAIYRYSKQSGAHESPLTYNKPSLKNEGFIIGV